MKQIAFMFIFHAICVYVITSERGKCSPGKFGWKCKFSCNCGRGPCDPTSGYCVTGCQKGKYGTGCLLDSQCLYDIKGINYTGNIGVTKDGKKCIRWMDEFVQGEGYTRDRFNPGDKPGRYCRNPRNRNGAYAAKPWCFYKTEGSKPYGVCDIKTCECSDGLFGPSCSYVCHCREVDEVCHKVMGTCNSGCADGWTGNNCQKSCEAGKYGYQCKKDCGNCYQNLCDQEYGDCRNGCTAGFRGLDCRTECQDKHYGRNCVEKCGFCRKNETCNPRTGVCFLGCADGYTGDKCVEKCPAGQYGFKCKSNCGNCRVGTTCDHVTGKCPHGCVAGMMGEKCNRDCLVGNYGVNCTFVCGKCKNGTPCLPSTGQCMDGCRDGYLGNNCITAEDHDFTVIGHPVSTGFTSAAESPLGITTTAITVILVVALVIISSYICYRRMVRTQKPPSDTQLEGSNEYCEIDDNTVNNVYEEIENLQIIGAQEPETQTLDAPRRCLVPPGYEHLHQPYKSDNRVTGRDILYITPLHTQVIQMRSQPGIQQKHCQLSVPENSECESAF